jgi:predicted dehydrogenase
MEQLDKPGLDRRTLLRTGGGYAAASALAGVSIPLVHAANDDPTLRLALVGCGGRGTGAVSDALSTSASLGPVELHAMADVFEGKLAGSLDALKGRFQDRVDVPKERQFVGFDGYKNAMDSLRPGDIAILTTPCAFRWPMFEYAIEKGLHVFMEKPVTADGFSSRKMLELNEKAKEKNLKVGVGLMCRHCEARGQLFEKIQEGLIGDVVLMRAYRMQAPIATCFSKKNTTGLSDLQYQIQRFHSFLWLSGGSFSDFFIHNIDECCWMKNAFPVEAKAIGGRHYREDNIDQNFDSYSVEYTFEDGAKLYMEGRNMPGAHNEFASFAHGTKGSAVISTAGHAPAHPRLFSDQRIEANPRRPSDSEIWRWPDGVREPNPYQLEWEHLLEAIRHDQPFNEVERGVAASVVTSMGRMAAHTGQVITYDQMLNSEHVFAPGVEELTLDSDSPLMPDADGVYPVPEPGVKKDREY